MTVCERDGCGHAVGQHVACGPCKVDGCECVGFKLLTRAERKAIEITRCSGCGRRVRPGGPHGPDLRVWEGERSWPCPRKGKGPDRAEGWRP